MSKEQNEKDKVNDATGMTNTVENALRAIMVNPETRPWLTWLLDEMYFMDVKSEPEQWVLQGVGVGLVESMVHIEQDAAAMIIVRDFLTKGVRDGRRGTSDTVVGDDGGIEREDPGARNPFDGVGEPHEG